MNIRTQRQMHAIKTAVAASALALSTLATAESVTLSADRDSTIIEPSPGELSLGSAWQIYVGRVGPNGGSTLRRGLMRFPVDSIPTGSTITSVTINLYMSKGAGAAQTVSAKRCLSDWGEGLSFAFGGGGAPPEPNDVTWTKRFFPNIAWTTPGGDFLATASATRFVGNTGWYAFGSTSGLIADVQAWVDGDAQNHGWVFTGNEVTVQTAKRFEGRDTNALAWRPTLVVEYTLPSVPGDINGDRLVDGADLAIALGSWGSCGACAADLNGDEVVDGADLAIVLGNWSP